MSRLSATRMRHLVSVLLVLCGVSLVLSPTATEAATLSVTAYAQEERYWCWAAAAKSIIRYTTGTTLSQCTIVKRGRATTTCDNVTGTKAHVRRAFDTSGVNPGTEVNLTWSHVTSEIANSRPIYSSIAWKSGGGHAHVVYGHYSAGSTVGVNYIDPWNGTKTAMQWSAYTSNSDWTLGTSLIYLYAK